MMSLVELMRGIREGQIALPDFQRDFDWSQNDILALLVTVLSGWPAGSLLLMNGKGAFFKLRRLEGAPDVSDEPEFIVLDGQQRLTSLFYAIEGGGPTVYALDWELASMEDGDLDDCLCTFARNKWDAEFASYRNQAQRHLMPLSVLSSPSDFFDWRDRIVDSTPVDHKERTKKTLTDLYRGTLSAIHDYEFPAVTLERNIDPAAIARIFERVNRHGMRLSAFDLMVAKVYEPDWNLRDHWESVLVESPLVEEFLAEDGLPALQGIALYYEGDLRQKAVLNLSKPTVHEAWSSSVSALEAAIEFLVHECGVETRKLMPYQGMIIPLVALYMESGLNVRREVLQQWFWFSAFGQVYDAAANTRLVSDYKRLKEIFESGGEIEPTVPPSWTSIWSATRKSDKSLWAAFINALTLSINQLQLEERVELGVSNRIGENELKFVSIYQSGGESVALADNAPLHQRILGVVGVPASLVRSLPKSDYPSARNFLLEHGLERLIEKQFLPLDDDSDYRDWKALFAHRIERLEEFLTGQIEKTFLFER